MDRMTSIGLLITTISALALGACVSRAQPCATTRPAIQPMSDIAAHGGLDGLAKKGIFVAIVQRGAAYPRGRLDLFVIDRKTRGALHWFQGDIATQVDDLGKYRDTVLVRPSAGQILINWLDIQAELKIPPCGETSDSGSTDETSLEYCNNPKEDPGPIPDLPWMVRIALAISDIR